MSCFHWFNLLGYSCFFWHGGKWLWMFRHHLSVRGQEVYQAYFGLFGLAWWRS